MSLSRRDFLLRTAATAAVLSIPGAKARAHAVIYCNRTIRHWAGIDYIDGLSQQVVHTIIYGNPEEAPTQFTGFAPFYSMEHV